MTKRARILALFAVLVVSGAALVIGWQYWPPLLRYREIKLRLAYDNEIRRYLDGADSLDVAAHRLAAILLKLGSLAEKQVVSENSNQWSTLEITSIGLSDIPRDDPRVQELVLNAFKHANPPGVSEAFRARTTQVWDSIIHEKGYRSVP